MGTIGSEIRLARERAGLSVQDLAARTKIRPPVLEAIERNDLSVLPTGVLGRGFLRAIARELGLDPESLVRRYRADAPSDAAIAEVARQLERRPPPLDAGDGSGWGTLLGVAAILAISLVAGAYLGGREEQRARRETSAVATTGIVERVASMSADSTTAAAGLPTEVRAVHSESPASSQRAAESPLNVELAVSSAAWIEATADGARVVYALVHPGERRSIEAQRDIRLRVGDAAAVDYSINGVHGRPLGRRGEVRDVRITPENWSTFRRP